MFCSRKTDSLADKVNESPLKSLSVTNSGTLKEIANFNGGNSQNSKWLQPTDNSFVFRDTHNIRNFQLLSYEKE